MDNSNHLSYYGVLVISYRVITWTGIVFMGLAVLTIPIVYILDTNHKLPCNWVEGNFGANTTYYQEYEKRCAETWRSNG